MFLAQVGGTVHSIAPAPRQPGAAFRIGLARQTRRGRTAAGDERAASLEETASASPAGGNVVAFRTGPQADVGASERAGADVAAHPEIGKKRHERPLENEAGAVGDEPDDEVLARIVGAADGQAIPPQALAGSANIVDLKRAGGRRHSAGPGGPPRAESERPHPPTLTAHDRSLDKTGVDRLGTESENVAEDDPMESRAPAASDDLVLNTVSALAEFERIRASLLRLMWLPSGATALKFPSSRRPSSATCPNVVCGPAESKPQSRQVVLVAQRHVGEALDFERGAHRQRRREDTSDHRDARYE